MKAPLLVLLFLLLALVPTAIAQSPRDVAAEAKIKKALEGIVIPKLEFRDGTLKEAVDFLNNEWRNHSQLSRDAPIKLELRPQFGPPAPGDAAVITAPEDAKITIRLTDIPLNEALKYVTLFSKTKFWIRPDGIHVVAEFEPEPMFTHDFRIPPDFFPAYERQDRLDHTNYAVQIKKDFRAWLVDNGVSLPVPDTAVLNKTATQLTVNTTRDDQFSLIQKILETERPPRAYPRAIPNAAF